MWAAQDVHLLLNYFGPTKPVQKLQLPVFGWQKGESVGHSQAEVVDALGLIRQS
jgi:hypothetical protein